MHIRKTVEQDLVYLDPLFNLCRQFMSDNGNASQWDQNYPNAKVVAQDIINDCAYVCVDDNNQIIGSFALNSYESEYDNIYDGKWNYDEPYVVVHRMAAIPHSGAGSFMLKYIIGHFNYIRIDTHQDNHIMMHLLPKLGFKACGKVTYEGYGERITFDYKKAKDNFYIQDNYFQVDSNCPYILRRATFDDTKRFDEIFDECRAFMHSQGNTKQWAGNFPNSSMMYESIKSGNTVVCMDKNTHEILAFCTLGSKEEVYDNSPNSVWTYNEPYVVMHRLAASLGHKAGRFLLEHTLQHFTYIRLDTHEDNKPMIRLMKKLNFKYCGYINYVRANGCGHRITFDWHK